VLALLVVTIWLAGAHGTPSDRSWAAGAPAQSARPIFLPLVVASPRVSIQFGTGVDSQNNLLNPGTTFAYGIARLYYRYTITGAAGLPYRTEWFVDGARQPQLDDSGSMPAEVSVFTNYFCSPTLGDCSQPVPRAAYRVRLYVADALYADATARVE
jgi:hypothetical protein